MKAGAQHPAVELLARASGEWPSRFALHRSWRLADQEERRSPSAFEGRACLRDDALVDAGVASSARGLVGEKGCPRQMTRARRGFGAAPGTRPRLVIGLPPISLMSAVKAIGGAELIDIPTPYEWMGHFAASNSRILAASRPPETKMPTWL